MRVGDHDPSFDEAGDMLREFAISHHETVLWFDLGGDTEGQPGRQGAADPVDAVTMADIGRLVVIAARPQPDDVPILLNAAPRSAFTSVPARARLEEWEARSSLDRAATELYNCFRRKGIGQAKRSKLLHLKRPWLVPIYDTHVTKVYQRRARSLRAEVGSLAAAWWEASKRDLIDGAPEFSRLAADLAADPDPAVRRVSKLTPLRLLDILAWSLDGKR